MSRFPFAVALRHSFQDGYGTGALRADLGAAIVVALIALPLSMALAIAVSLPPQHGLYTAIVAGIATALLGGSRFQVTGPTAAFVAILVPIVSQYGLTGLVWCQLMAGGFLILMGIFKLGKYIEHVPYAVTTGFTVGIAVVIATLSLNDFFGLHIEHMGDHYWNKVVTIMNALPGLSPAETIVAVVTMMVMILLPRFTKSVPAPIVAIIVGTLLSMIAAGQGMAVDTIDSRFSYIMADGTAGAGIPPYLPQFHLPEHAAIAPLIVPAITVALLAALESLLSATIADNITNTKHHPNGELIGLGFGNLLSGLFAGIPATGALARTAANIHAGARTPLSAVFHSLFLLIFMLALAPYISEIPMASLAALLLMTAWRMAHIHLFVDVIKAGNNKDTIVLLTSFFLTVIFDMVIGVGAGLLLAWGFHITKRA